VIDPPGSKLSSAWTICSLWSPVVVHGSTKPELAMILGSTGCQPVTFRQLAEKLFANSCRHVFLVVQAADDCGPALCVARTSAFARSFDQLTFALSNCDPAASIKDQASA
jgi:hypothetical protein